MNLPKKLADTWQHLESNVFSPTQVAAIQQTIEVAGQADPAHQSPAVGDKIPNLMFSTLTEDPLDLYSLLETGPVVLSFYRGIWCPFCSLELQALEVALPAIVTLGATLVSVSPELPRRTRTVVEEQHLEHLLLFDPGNQAARQLGILFALPEAMRRASQELKIDLPQFNGDTSYELPVPATFIVAQDSTVAYRFVDPDYTKRLDPVEIVTILTHLKKR